MPKLLTKKEQDATDENYFIGGTGRRLPTMNNDVQYIYIPVRIEDIFVLWSSFSLHPLEQTPA
jgi:hypothetical protein